MFTQFPGFTSTFTYFTKVGTGKHVHPVPWIHLCNLCTYAPMHLCNLCTYAPMHFTTFTTFTYFTKVETGKHVHPVPWMVNNVGDLGKWEAHVKSMNVACMFTQFPQLVHQISPLSPLSPTSPCACKSVQRGFEYFCNR